MLCWDRLQIWRNRSASKLNYDQDPRYRSMPSVKKKKKKKEIKKQQSKQSSSPVQKGWSNYIKSLPCLVSVYVFFNKFMCIESEKTFASFMMSLRNLNKILWFILIIWGNLTLIKPMSLSASCYNDVPSGKHNCDTVNCDKCTENLRMVYQIDHIRNWI